MADSFPFLKGHGTENDFVLLPDPDGSVHGDPSPELVAALCDRRAGIGGDGVLRVVRCADYEDPSSVAVRGVAEWFMDYRNSDGSLSQMCGNGLRLFARYLADHQDADTSKPLPVGTRAGLKLLRFDSDGDITADMGEAEVFSETKVSVDEHAWPALHVSMGNPHAVAFVNSLEDAGSLASGPTYDASVFPHGVNVEFVVRRGKRHVAMRVHERGSGETRSCGTGACAVMVAAAITDGAATSTSGTWRVEEDVSYRVDVLGGDLEVTWTVEGRVLLRGPAVIVAQGFVHRSALGSR